MVAGNAGRGPRLRVVCVNDVYSLENLPRLKGAWWRRSGAGAGGSYAGDAGGGLCGAEHAVEPG